ncbi:MAG: hypothetical protein K2Y03_11545, partial [Sphingomonas sp.]|nr:hypothetical protein [Sphingomonas sp.]
MTPHPDDFNARWGAALDRFDVPPPSPDFLARLSHLPQGAGAPAARWAFVRRRADGGRRGPWVRRALIGVAVIGLTGTAAATGFFQELARRLPGLTQLVAAAPDPAPVVSRPAPRISPPTAAAAPAVQSVAPPVAPAPVEGAITRELAAPVAVAGPAPVVPVAAAPVPAPVAAEMRRPLARA